MTRPELRAGCPHLFVLPEGCPCLHCEGAAPSGRRVVEEHLPVTYDRARDPSSPDLWDAGIAVEAGTVAGHPVARIVLAQPDAILSRVAADELIAAVRACFPDPQLAAAREPVPALGRIA